MPRKPRELEDGGIYHIYNRGNNQRILFHDNQDFNTFSQIWLKAKERYEFWIFHYCWMHTHFHVLIKIKHGEFLGNLMHWVQLSYARYYRKRYRAVGRFFQERYRSPRISKESYYLQCGRYIERNPVAAGMLSQAFDYQFSSASFYALGSAGPLLSENKYYRELGSNPRERQKNYVKFLSLDDPYRSMVDETLVRTSP